MLFAQGLGFAIPFVSMLFQYFAYRRLTRTGTTLWDTATGSVVSHAKWGPLRWASTVIVVTSMAFVMAVLSNLQPLPHQLQREARAPATAGSPTVSPPTTGAPAHVAEMAETPERLSEVPRGPVDEPIDFVTLGSAIATDKSITFVTDVFEPHEVVYASVPTTIPGHTKLRALWTYVEGDRSVKVHEDSLEFEALGPTMNEFHVQNKMGWPVGDYRLQIFYGDTGNPAVTRNFRVVSPRGRKRS